MAKIVDNDRIGDLPARTHVIAPALMDGETMGVVAEALAHVAAAAQHTTTDEAEAHAAATVQVQAGRRGDLQ